MTLIRISFIFSETNSVDAAAAVVELHRQDSIKPFCHLTKSMCWRSLKQQRNFFAQGNESMN